MQMGVNFKSFLIERVGCRPGRIAQVTLIRCGACDLGDVRIHDHPKHFVTLTLKQEGWKLRKHFGWICPRCVKEA